MEPRQRHWQNRLEPGDTFFVSTTCLDFVHALATAEIRDLLVASLAGDCLRVGASLHAFVVMPHHLHFLATAPETINPLLFVRQFKSNSARRIRPLLCPQVESSFDAQRGLNRRSFWQSGFRAVPVFTARAFLVKVECVHTNPVRAELCEEPEAYRWSSAWAFTHGLGLDRALLDCAALVTHYAPGGLPRVAR